MHHTLNECVLRLNLIEGVGPATIETLIKNGFAHDCAANGPLSAAEITQRYHLNEMRAQILADGLKQNQLLEKELALIEQQGIQWVTCFDEHYPTSLKNMHMPPPLLYWRGTLPTTEKLCLAIVGARKANEYAEETLASIIPHLVDNGFTIVSGGAIGADCIAHAITLKNDGATVAILGSGLLNLYPTSNGTLFNQIVEQGGALVSSFPLTFPPLQGNFPARNRIIAGLSRGCLVVQAAEKSGALITARFALDEGREVFAIPGPIDDPLSTGCHHLIQQGAQLVHSHVDILSAFGIELTEQTAAQNLHIFQEKKEAPAHKRATHTNLSEHEQNIINWCQRPCSLDDLLEMTNVSFAELCATLCTLQLNGYIEQLASGQWQINSNRI